MEWGWRSTKRRASRPARKTVLKPGMVITIEPGVYFPGKWGVSDRGHGSGH